MNQNLGSRQDALNHLRFADGVWTEAVRTFRPYADRLRRLAEAADAQRRAFLFAEVCEVKRTARTRVPSLPLAPELEPPNRAGPTDSWAKFDHAREALGGALADNNRMAVARAFKDIAQAVADVADALDVPDGPR